MSVRKGALAYTVRMGMGAAESQELADLLPRCPEDVEARLHDQFWLRSVFIEQQRRTRIAERSRFCARADRILAALDPPADSFNALVEMAQEILDRIYPADIFNTDHPIVGDDPGTKLVAALREVLAVRG